LAWPERALAFRILKPSHAYQLQLGPGLAWPRLQLLIIIKTQNIESRNVMEEILEMRP
jgi:hypothetical protein